MAHKLKTPFNYVGLFDNAIRRFADKEITHAKAEPAQVAKDNNG